MNWQSASVAVDGITIDIKADADGVELGKTVDGLYASDLHLTPEQARAIADALIEGAARCLAAREA